jgi:hypothetical protein
MPRIKEKSTVTPPRQKAVKPARRPAAKSSKAKPKEPSVSKKKKTVSREVCFCSFCGKTSEAA